MPDQYDVIGIGNAIVDVLCKTEDSFIEEHDLNKGNMTLIEAEQAESLYADMGPAIEMSGGSAANTIAALSSMGGNCGFIGKVADDQLGNVFRHDIKAVGADFSTSALQDSLPTARCLILVTPDAERTMCTFLGASVWISESDIDRQKIASGKVTYLEGYLFDKPKAKKAFLKAAQIAHEAGRKVALSLSDAFCVNRHRDEFLELVEGHVDILFANEEEICALYQEKDINIALKQIQGQCEIVAVTQGAKGAVIVTKDNKIEVPSTQVSNVVDTTGAGDLFAAGFLYGFTQGEPLETCGQYGCRAAAAVIQHMGARVQKNLKDIIKEGNVVYG